MRHGRVRHSLHQVRSGNDATKKFIRAQPQHPFAGLTFDEKIEPVDVLPHLARDLLAHRSRVFARGGETRIDRVRVLPLQANEVDCRLTVRVLIKRGKKLVLFQRANDWIPLLLGVGVACVLKIKEQLQIDISDAGVVFRPLDVAAHPEKGICNATQHTELERWNGGVVEEWRWAIMSRSKSMSL